MHAKELTEIAESIYKQIHTFNNIMLPKKAFHQAVHKSFTGHEKSYEDLKLAKKKLYIIIGKNADIQPTKLLEFIAKSFGYENHHSMKRKLPLKKPYRLINKRVSRVELLINMAIRNLQNSIKNNPAFMLSDLYREAKMKQTSSLRKGA